MIEWITLIVFALTLGALVKYTRDTTKLKEIEEQRRVVEHDQLIRQYDLNLELLDFEDQQGKLVLYLRNVGGPVRDVKIEPATNVKVLRQQRQERWYPTIGYIIFEHSPEPPEQPGPLSHFAFTALYTNKLQQRRTKSFVVLIDRKRRGWNWISEVDTIDGEYPDHLEKIGKYLPPTRTA